ncbi:MAG: hypothetical protein ABIE94_02695 [archaeon]
MSKAGVFASLIAVIIIAIAFFLVVQKLTSEVCTTTNVDSCDRSCTVSEDCYWTCDCGALNVNATCGAFDPRGCDENMVPMCVNGVCEGVPG